MPDFASPLRYPGGKEGLYPLLGHLAAVNGWSDRHYAEAYAGGAGAALRLLYGEHVSTIIINDLDYCIFSLWNSILHQCQRLVNIISSTTPTIDEWHKQREVYCNPHKHSQLRVGFATFFLNRCNRSGILPNGGPIGGHLQAGRWKIDARYYAQTVRRRIERISSYKSRIRIHNLDAIEFMRSIASDSRSRLRKTFVYLDPPYYDKGSKLYLNAYEHGDHQTLASYLRRRTSLDWVMTYDNQQEIRKLYHGFKLKAFSLRYTAHSQKSGKELLISPRHVTIPRDVSTWIAARSACK